MSDMSDAWRNCVGSNKEYIEIPNHYTPECPICKGVMLPEKVEELEKTVRILQDHIDGLHSEASTIEKLEWQLENAKKSADQWRDLYQEASGHQETGLEYRNWQHDPPGP